MDDLIELGFQHIGAWRTPDCRVHRIPSLRQAPGIYAFVVGGKVQYLGQADALHRRLRNYSNRCFRPIGAKALRPVHTGIINALNSGACVEVYVLLTEPSRPLSPLETTLRDRFKPPWDRTLSKQQSPAG